ncbi:hypothetical protein ACS0TY_034004 [Phlomoides rotata]
MASSLRRLRHIYSQKPTYTAAIVTSTADGMPTVSHTTTDKASSSPSSSFLHVSLKKSTSTTAVATSTTVGKFEDIVNKFKKHSSKSGFRKKRLIYKTTVYRLAKAGHSSYIHDILDHQKQYPDIQDEHFTSRLICLYGEAKMLGHALQLFDEMPELSCPRTVLSFNALMAACLSSENFSKAVEIFQEFPGKLSVEPNVISYTTAMKAFCKMGLLNKAVSLLDEMEKNDVVPNAITFDTLLGALYGRGRFSEGEKLWELMREKNVIPDLRCYNSRMNGLVNENRISEAVELMQNEFEEQGLKPNSYTYGVFIKGFANEGNLEEAKKWYAEMLELQLDPIFFTFASLVEFACLKNDADFALELCNKSLGLKKWISSKVMQKAINVLVENSKMEGAKQLLEAVSSTRISMYAKLSLPVAED